MHSSDRDSPVAVQGSRIGEIELGPMRTGFKVLERVMHTSFYVFLDYSTYIILVVTPPGV